VSRPTGAEVDRRLALLGRDLALFYPGPSGWWEDADFATTLPSPSVRTVDLDVVSGVAAADQLFVNRLKTHRGELAPLGHPEYGSRHHELIGQPNVARTRALVKLHVLECLSHEPRIARVRRCDVVAGFRRDEVRIEIDVEITGEPNPRLLVVPFNLAVGIESASEPVDAGVAAAGGAA
jgi:phage baseplate assembly protein W